MKRLNRAAIGAAFEEDIQEAWVPHVKKQKAVAIKGDFPVLRHTDQGNPVHIWTDALDSAAWRQSAIFADLSFVHPKGLALMPDVHMGRDVCVGSVLPTLGALVPSAVGTDIGCGMMAVKLDLAGRQLPDQLKDMRMAIERAVPLGAGGKHHVCPASAQEQWARLSGRYEFLCDRHPIIHRASAAKQLGTLGSGNHFIEVCLDETSQVWVMLHSGSRGVGGAIGQYFIDQAWKKAKDEGANIGSLGWFPDSHPLFDPYVEALEWAQEFATANREVMMRQTLDAISATLGKTVQSAGEVVQCHHNYVARERHFDLDTFVTRKGAIRAGVGEMGIVPGCFAAGTRILMSNGLYKNIELVNTGDRIIAGDGSSVSVVQRFNKGTRLTWKYENNGFHQKTVVTPDHLHYIGNMSSCSKSKDSMGRVKILSTRKIDGSSKYEWMALRDAEPRHHTLLMPRTIDFADMPVDFQTVIFGKPVKPSYNLGYVFGTFIGDGTTYYKSADGGQVSWSFGLHETSIAQKLATSLREVFGCLVKVYPGGKCLLVIVHSAELAQFFYSFGKKSNKALPADFWCADIPYLKGLYDGLMDSDGHVGSKTNKFTNTSTTSIEQFGVIHYLLFGYFPSVSVRQPSAGGLKDCKLENCLPSYRATGLILPPLTDDHQLMQLLRIDKNEQEVEVFDLEVDHADHSFIANNAIVHNSMGAESFVVKGLGHAQSYCSCSHGAGRAMSRSAAKSQFTVEDLKAQTSGVECRKIKALVDELPSAYKPIRTVMNNQRNLVEVVHTLKQVVCVKGG